MNDHVISFPKYGLGAVKEMKRKRLSLFWQCVVICRDIGTTYRGERDRKRKHGGEIYCSRMKISGWTDEDSVLIMAA
ncbi:MAG: hypothetical protein ACK5MT_19380 [Actinomycetales bacterium]